MAIFCTDISRKSDGEGGRVAVLPAPKYQFGVLEDGWQYRRPNDVLPQPQPYKKESLPPFKGCSTYNTSYRPPPASFYEPDPSAWKNRVKAEGFCNDLLEGDEKECRENFTTTTDLVYRIIPQLCPRLREYNTNALEWFPSQNFLPCYGNLTQHGLKEKKKLEWAVDKNLMKGMPSSELTTVTTDNGLSTTFSSTTYCDHYREPPQDYLVKERKGIIRNLSSKLEPTNKQIAKQKLRGQSNLTVPQVDPGTVPVPECRFPLPIVPMLPEEPPYRITSAQPKEAAVDQNWASQIAYPQLSRRAPVEVCTS